MADESIRQDFIEGVHEVFTSLFNEGKSSEDGISLYRYSDTKQSIYKEVKYKKYKSPIILVAKVSETPEDGEQDIKKQKRSAVFTVPLKSLMDNYINMTKSTIDDLKKGMIMFNDVYYNIDKIQGKAFVENLYVIWEFYCTEDPSISELSLEE